MSTSAPDSAPVVATLPESLARALEAANFSGSLAVCRSDGAAFTDEDRQRLAAVLLGYDAARELDLSDDELADLAAKHSTPRTRQATGTGGE